MTEGVEQETSVARDQKIEAAIALVEDGPTLHDRALGIQRLGHLQAEFQLVVSASYSRSAHMRTAGAQALASFPDGDTGGRLQALLADQAPSVRAAAVSAIGRSGKRGLADVVLAIADDPGEAEKVRANALVAASRLAHAPAEEAEVLDLLAELRQGSEVSTANIARALRHLDSDEATEILLEMLDEMLETGNHPERDANQVVTAFRGREMTPELQTLLVEVLDALPGARGTAAQMLAESPTEAARPGLERLLKDANRNLRRHAVQALGALGLEPSLESVRAVICEDDAAGAELVGSLGATPGATSLLEAIARDGPYHQVVALHALVAQDPERARVLARALRLSPNPKVRVGAYRCLALGTTTAEGIEALRAQVDSDERVRWAATDVRVILDQRVERLAAQEANPAPES